VQRLEYPEHRRCASPGRLYSRRVLFKQRNESLRCVDTSIAGVFQYEHVAREREAAERRNAREQGLVVEDDDSPDGGWQVSWKVEEYPVS
jgi:hypothetical protein